MELRALRLADPPERWEALGFDVSDASCDLGGVRLQLGARGIVLKDSATQLLLKAIQTVMAGEYWVGRESVSNLVQYLRTLMQSSHDEARQRKFGLTPRELEIVSAVVAGFSNKEIAEYFKISEDTVKHHLSNIFDKLGVSTRLELALFAVNQSLPLKSIN